MAAQLAEVIPTPDGYDEAYGHLLPPPPEVIAEWAAAADTTPSAFVLETLEEMRQRRPAEYVLPPLVVRGVNFLVGAPGTLKTFHALRAAAHIEGATVYVSREGTGSLAPRLDAYVAASGRPEPDVRFVTDEVQLPHDTAALVHAIAAAGVWPALVVVDTLTDASVALDENGPEMRAAYAAMRTIQAFFDCGVLTIVHTGWNTARERGHSSIRGMSDNTMLLERNSDTGVARLTCVKVRDGDPPAPSYWRLASPEEAVAAGIATP